MRSTDAAAAPRPRPQLHFTPQNGWMNDPNGLVEIDGVHHLCYQHNPTEPRWGNLHWGRATSADLVTWEHHPIAITPDDLGEAFSGSAVVDAANSAGFGAGALVAVYTSDLRGVQRQSLSVSRDGGATWEPFAGNPVIDAPAEQRDFRDPKVFRHGDGSDLAWIMVLAVGPELWIYRSADLQRWERSSTFSVPAPWAGAIVEVPELMRVPVEGSDDHVWILVVSLIPPEGVDDPGARVRWMVVDFDGYALRTCPDHAGRVLDHGRHLYAPMAWCFDDDRAPILVGWIDETAICGEGEIWCGRLSFPRALTAWRRDGSTRLRLRPLLDRIPTRWRETRSLAPNAPVAVDARSLLVDVDTAGSDVEVRFVGDDDRVVIRAARDGTWFDGRRIGDPARPARLNVLVDAGSIELFVDDGLESVSEARRVGLATTTLEIVASDDFAGVSSLTTIGPVGAAT